MNFYELQETAFLTKSLSLTGTHNQHQTPG